MPHAAEAQPSDEPPARDTLPDAMVTEDNAVVGSGEIVHAPVVPQPGRGSENLAYDERTQLARNGLKNGHSPTSSLSLHPTSSDSEEGLAMGQRMQQLPRSPSAVRLLWNRLSDGAPRQTTSHQPYAPDARHDTPSSCKCPYLSTLLARETRVQEQRTSRHTEAHILVQPLRQSPLATPQPGSSSSRSPPTTFLSVPAMNRHTFLTAHGTMPKRYQLLQHLVP